MHAGINKFPNLSRICCLAVGISSAMVSAIAPATLATANDAKDSASSFHQESGLLEHSG